MGRTRATQTFPVAVAEAERRWYDTGSWRSWVEGLEQLVAVEGDWPAAGSRVVWQSGPAGRGRVTETAVAYAAGDGQTVEVQDVSITGRQTVAFAAAQGGVSVTLALSYRIRSRSPITPLIDALFVRRAMTTSLRQTLDRFGALLGHDDAAPST